MKYIGSIVAFKGDKFNHCTVLIEADSLDEATGKGARLASQTYYPKANGYFNHSVSFAELGKMDKVLKESLKTAGKTVAR